jgi:hypothetical protein
MKKLVVFLGIFFIALAFAVEAFSAPTRVVDVIANASSPYIITVCWTSPAPTAGKVLTVNDLRVSTAPISALNWTTRTQVSEPSPSTPGTQQCTDIVSLSSTTTYYVGLKVQDSGGTWSTLSNIAVTITYAATKNATLSWSQPLTNADGTPLDDLAGYKLYYGTTSGNYTTSIDVGNVTTFVTPNLTWGVVYYFSLTAYDTSGNESGYSNEIN